MKKFALIGKKLGHSYSQRWFEELFARLGLEDHSYRLVEMPTLEHLRDWVQTADINGFNVTAPYKQEVIPYLDELDDVAAAIGAVNCVTVDNGRLTGHNTDAPAFGDTLSSLRDDNSAPFTRAFILGTGGAARGVAFALGQMGIPYTFVSRTPERHQDAISYDELSVFAFESPTLIVNATPMGMYPAVDATPLDLSHTFSHSHIHTFFYDLIYNPSPTLFLRQAAALGAKTKDGLEMLHRQAELSWELFQQC